MRESSEILSLDLHLMQLVYAQDAHLQEDEYPQGTVWTGGQ